MRTLLIIFLIVFSVVPIPIVFFQSAVEDSLPNGIVHRWKASDLSASPVSVWTDSVSGYNWTASGTAQPAWDANGVSFDGVNDTMTGTNITTSEVLNWLVVLDFDVTTANQMVLCNTYAGANIFVGIGSVAEHFYEGGLGDNALGPIGTSTFDIIVAKTGANSFNVYTNGTSGWSSAGGWNNSVNIARIGSGSGNAFFDGIIKEVIVWSNQTFTAQQISDIHSYATNTYNFSP